ncbi:NrdH-redoxin [archaeon]|nr:MAG: NrdH-redoxin [archaeon]RLG64870.1 MAG: NrdH-redoxin [archaeon]RLG65035.1 MAG: NrdH-redoxin [archaeon]HDM23760.1 NrdH-redoxin [Candidatus Bathyarchaeota archaeon]
MKVRIYTTPRCPKCKILKKFLARKGIQFEELNLEDSDVAAELIMRDVFDLTTPILEIGEKLYLEDDLFNNDELNVEKLERILK